MRDESLMINEMVQQIKQIIGKARSNVAIVVNSELIAAYWNIGRIIIEHEQENNERAAYGKQTLKELSKVLSEEFGKGFSVSNLQFMRRFYQTYQIQQTLSVKLSWSHYCELLLISEDDKRNFYFKKRWSLKTPPLYFSFLRFFTLLLQYFLKTYKFITHLSPRCATISGR